MSARKHHQATTYFGIPEFKTYHRSERIRKYVVRIGFDLPSNWFSFDKKSSCYLNGNTFAVSGIVIAEPGVRATTRSIAHIGMKSSTSFSRSQPSSNTKKNSISQTTSSNKKNKVEDHLRSVKSSLCVLNYVNDVNVCAKSKYVTSKKKKVWKPTGKVFNNVGYRWKPTGRTYTIAGNTCPLTMITSTPIVPPKETSQTPVTTSNLEIKIYRKRKKHTHKPKSDDSIQEKLYLLHMDLCGPMRIESINGKKYILVIVGDYSRFTWVKFLRLKDKTLEIMIKLLKKIQVHLNATVQNIRTDNGTEFVNQTLQAYYDDVGISHQTLVARTPQQNDVVEAVVTACYTQNRSLIRRRHNKTPYELIHDRKPDLMHFHVFVRYAIQPMTVRIRCVSPVPTAAASRPVDPTGSPSLTSIDQAAPSTITSLTIQETQSLVT
ncbi:retrovirus-related pol polyprotein from transposon TNT 1-94 [Tanacetum coccineum]